MKEYFINQYEACFKMLASCIRKYDPDLWIKTKPYSYSASQIAYHAIFFTNVYAAPAGDKIVFWSKETKGYEMMGRMPFAPRKEIFRDECYTQKEMQAYIRHVKKQIPEYLKNFKPKKDCWPGWYNLSCFEFQLNNLRHLQHHIGQLMERQNAVKKFKINWETFE